MKINEHTAGSQVRLLYIGREDNEMLTTEILDVPSGVNSNDNIIVCKPIIIDEQYVGFTTRGLIAEITKPELVGMHRYRVDLCGHINCKGTIYLAMRSYDDVEPYNRRSQFRVEFTAFGEIQPRANTKVYPCSIHDISFNGIGINVRKESGFDGEVGDSASISFKHPRSERIYKVRGPISRIEDSKVNEDFYAVGVSLETDNMYWTGLVAKEQRRNIKRQRGMI